MEVTFSFGTGETREPMARDILWTRGEFSKLADEWRCDETYGLMLYYRCTTFDVDFASFDEFFDALLPVELDEVAKVLLGFRNLHPCE